ncbi:exosome complex component csl4 [Limosa lapponica baueri]|uniref:Exosome complex component csl4 n=1 Tax=Limosa lapponica baueri TaxID=1758121 RepID=A0A2I0T479_LIMLA|nr:exosome complex component csl4 [Limosa lapponica baueri]
MGWPKSQGLPSALPDQPGAHPKAGSSWTLGDQTHQPSPWFLPRCPVTWTLRQPLSPRPSGERLCSAEEATAGSGTYTRHGFIFSSLAGCLEKRSEDSGLPVVSVVRDAESQLLPDVGAVVTCKVGGQSALGSMADLSAFVFSAPS